MESTVESERYTEQYKSALFKARKWKNKQNKAKQNKKKHQTETLISGKVILLFDYWVSVSWNRVLFLSKPRNSFSILYKVLTLCLSLNL